MPSNDEIVHTVCVGGDGDINLTPSTKIYINIIINHFEIVSKSSKIHFTTNI